MINGDFNSHNQIWHSKYTNTRGKILEKVIKENNLIILNENKPTYFRTATGQSSIIDLSLCSASIAHRFYWDVSDDLEDSDHFLIFIKVHNELNNSAPSNYQQRWYMAKADWEYYTYLMEENITLNNNILLNN